MSIDFKWNFFFKIGNNVKRNPRKSSSNIVKLITWQQCEKKPKKTYITYRKAYCFSYRRLERAECESKLSCENRLIGIFSMGSKPPNVGECNLVSL